MKRKKRQKEPLKVELIPIYISEEEFAEKKEFVQNLIAKILLEAHFEEQKEKKDSSIPTTI
ncbi:MAG: hypothetical protein HUU57_12890 [Bdellovibrio sp.]|nr:hypothetical protein [Bdellovibrio sp.]